MSPDQGNLEIQEALEQFESEEQQKKLQTAQVTIKKQSASMTESLIKNSGGLIKNERTAGYVLLGIAIGMFSLSLYLFSRGGTNSTPSPVDLKNIDQSQFLK